MCYGVRHRQVVAQTPVAPRVPGPQFPPTQRVPQHLPRPTPQPLVPVPPRTYLEAARNPPVQQFNSLQARPQNQARQQTLQNQQPQPPFAHQQQQPQQQQDQHKQQGPAKPAADGGARAQGAGQASAQPRVPNLVPNRVVQPGTVSVQTPVQAGSTPPAQLSTVRLVGRQPQGDAAPVLSASCGPQLHDISSAPAGEEEAAGRWGERWEVEDDPELTVAEMDESVADPNQVFARMAGVKRAILRRTKRLERAIAEKDAQQAIVDEASATLSARTADVSVAEAQLQQFKELHAQLSKRHAELTEEAAVQKQSENTQAEVQRAREVLWQAASNLRGLGSDPPHRGGNRCTGLAVSGCRHT